MKLTPDELLSEDIQEDNQDMDEIESEEHKSKHDFFVNFVENNEYGASTCIIEGKYTSYK